MEDDLPVTVACEMPSFISSLEGAGVISPPNAATGSALNTSQVERSGNRGVSSSTSFFSAHGGLKVEEEGQSGGQEQETGSNNNNNCNGGGEGRRRPSAVDILRRNFGVSVSLPKSQSLILNPSSRMQHSVDHDSREKSVESCVATDHPGEFGDCEQSSTETRLERETKNEPALLHKSELTESDLLLSASGQRCYTCYNESMMLDGSYRLRNHVYCTVYCISNDTRRKDITECSKAELSAVPQVQDHSLESESVLYTLDDLVNPRGELTHQVTPEQVGTDLAVQSCRVCLEEKAITPLPCCRKPVCDECLKFYVSSQVRVGKAHINCPIPECSGSLEEGSVLAHLTNEDVAKYRYFLELSQLDASTKPCPQCTYFTSLKKQHNLIPVPNANINHSEQKYKIQCVRCQFVWCFKCHAPWHNGIKCRDYRKGDKLLRTWASVIEHGQRNAQKCPRCKIHIQRSEGCDHMTCTQCNTNFCYRCGERYRHLRFFGDHTSNLSVFGCKYRYLSDKPHLRRLIRGSVCASKLLIAPVVILLVVVLGSLALVIGLLVFPVYYVCKRRKKQNSQNSDRWI